MGSKIKEIEIYTDGSCSPNPGRGAYTAIIMEGDGEIKQICGTQKNTTNGRMELQAVISALESIIEPANITIYTDSSYVADTINKGWLQGWIKRGWKKSDGTPPEHIDLWKRFMGATINHSVEFIWVKGHADNIFNNRCDEMANSLREFHRVVDMAINKKEIKEGRRRGL